MKRGGAKSSKGFTIIEVMLSLAISGMVLVGALLGVSSTISRQRYRDTVETFAAVLRNQYELVSRVQVEQRVGNGVCEAFMNDVEPVVPIIPGGGGSGGGYGGGSGGGYIPGSGSGHGPADEITPVRPGQETGLNNFGSGITLAAWPWGSGGGWGGGAGGGGAGGGGVVVPTPTDEGGRGRSDCSIYGVAVSFGLDDGKKIQTTNIIGLEYNSYRKAIIDNGGDADDFIGRMSDIELLNAIGATNLYQETETSCGAMNLTTDENFKWGASAETTKKDTPLKMTLLLVRSPRDGTVHTYTMDYSNSSSLEPYDYSKKKVGLCDNSQDGKTKATVSWGLKNNKFTRKDDVKICINSEDMLATYGKRRMLKITADGHNSSAVVLMNMDDEGNECQ